MLTRYLGMIQVQRQDFNGRVLTIRNEDLRAIACLFETTTERRDSTSSPPRRARPRAAVGVIRVDTPSGSTCTSRSVRRRCDYCAFATWTDRHHLHGYLRRRVHAARSLRRRSPPATSRVLRRWDAVAARPRAARAHPGCSRARRRGRGDRRVQPRHGDAGSWLEAYRAGGVTRLSFGVQSMVPHVLESLGRTHDPANVRTCAELARSLGFASWNMDLIHGAAGESLADWRRTLDETLALEPPHLSAYALTVEPGTPLAGDPSRHPDDDDEADKYVLAERGVRRGRAHVVRDLELGARPATSAATTSSTGHRATTAASAAPRTPTMAGGGGGTSARPSATSPRSPPAALPRRRRRSSTRRPAASKGCSSRCALVTVSPLMRCRRRIETRSTGSSTSSTTPTATGCG